MKLSKKMAPKINQKKIIVWIAVVAVVLAAVVTTFLYVFSNTAENKTKITPLSTYFAEQMAARAVNDIGRPIEGFDSTLLIKAYPGLMNEDFDGVATLGGSFEIKNDGEIYFFPTDPKGRSTAEKTISESGYVTLLSNISKRLKYPVEHDVEVDQLIRKINTAEQASVRLGEKVSAMGVTLAPTRVVEDSRCPVNANCIWAGTMKAEVSVEHEIEVGPNAETEYIFELGKTVTIGAEEITLIQVDPFPQLQKQIDPTSYFFVFEIKRR